MKYRHAILKVRQYGLLKAGQILYRKFFPGKYPQAINIEIMTICNLKCRHCRVTYHGSLIKDVKPAFMKFELFCEMVDRITPFIKHANVFQFSSIEPLFHKDIFRMMAYVSTKNRNMLFPILTNAMLFNKDNLRELFQRNVPSISISLDGCQKETVEAFKTGVSFDRVISNIRLLKKMAPERINIATVFVATRNNIHELPDYITLCADLGINEVLVNGFLSFLPDHSHLYLYTPQGNNDVSDIFKNTYAQAEKHGVIVRFPSLAAKPRGCDLSSLLCIDEKGNVAPCIFLAHETPLELFGKVGRTRKLIFGNVLKDDPLKVWNSRDYVEFRNKLRQRSLPRECALCADGHGVICSAKELTPGSMKKNSLWGDK
ncbi:MAG: radical SAM protein [Deltaproteobacteria bacterium]|nr:radical SAM protein [Deltaproteobacteria bacterium]